VRYPGACEKSSPASTLIILGPSFSGAVDSVGALSERLGDRPTSVTDLCLVSSSTTDNTNGLVNKLYSRVTYTNLALDNGLKILHVMNLVRALMGATNYDAAPALSEESGEVSNRVAILAEASTYGHGICSDKDVTNDDPVANRSVKSFCDSTIFFYFPANIADIRYGLQEQRDVQRRSSALKLPATSEHLSLELGAENGSEYPDSRQSGLTSVSSELAMEQVLDTLKAVNPPPRIVIVVATDVRDRLFLFDEVRERLPRAMLIDLSADNLLGHPNFLHASRGALSMASMGLNKRVNRDLRVHIPTSEQIPMSDREPELSPSSPVSAWSSDVQAILEGAVGCMADATLETNGLPCGLPSPKSSTELVLRRQAAIHVVTLEGFKRVSEQFVFNEPSTGKQTLADWGLNVAEVGAPLLCTAAALLWLFPLIVPSGGWARRAVRIVNKASYTVCVLYAALLFAVAWDIHRVDYDNSVLFWILAGLACGFFGLICCILVLRHASQAAPPVSYWNACAPTLLALSAALMASTPLWWLRTVHSSFGQTVDLKALVQLGLDPDPGLAFLLLVALATLALLYASVVLATAAGIVNRNSTLLRRAQPSSQQPPKRLAAVKFNRRGIPHMNPFGLLGAAAIVVAAIVGPDLFSGNVRLTIFGQWASMVALLAITATTCSAALLACSGIGAARRVAALSEHILIARSGASGGAGLGPWSLDDSSLRVFPATPVIATVADGGRLAKKLRSTDDLADWTQLLKDWLYNGLNRSEHRVAVFTLLATEISVYRWSVAGAVLCTLASVGAVYLFPIEADRLLLLNLAILAALGVAAGYVATAFERDELLSNILCNRQPRRRFSAPLFAFIAAPFVVFALAVAIANVPGVVDWGGGLLQLLGALGVHA
jgi:hypothetical protein